MDIAQKLSELMDSRQMSRGALARALGVHTSTVTNWLSGKAVKSETLPAICDVFGCSIDYLLGTEQKEKPTAVSGSELSKKGKEIGMAYDAAVQEVRARMESAAFGRAPSHAVAKIEMVCSLGHGKQTIYQPVYCVAGKAMPFNPNNGCEHYHACPECEICRANAILKSFECDPLDCDLL